MRPNFEEMESPSYDLGSLCSSPLLYPEGDDFLGQPVNIFNDEDISFDFIDNFGTGFLIVGKDTNEVSTTSPECDQILISESPKLRRNETARKECNDKKTFKEESSRNRQVIGACDNENSDSAYGHTSASECINHEGFANEDTDTRTENVDSNAVCKNAETTGQNVKENHALSQNDRNINRMKNNRVDNNFAALDTSGDTDKHFNENVYANNNPNEKPVFQNFELSSIRAHKTSNKETCLTDTIRRGPNSTSLKKIDDSSFSVKSFAFKRCVVPKTFYSPFWTPEKSTSKEEKKLDDGFTNAQRNMDILYCCHCRSQKRDAKNARFTVKNETGLNKDGNKYIDFLKRNSFFKQQGISQKHLNKAINQNPSRHVDEAGINNDKCISLPAIYTAPSKPKTLAHQKKPIALSLTSIEELINKYKSHGFDLAEQQKRYRLKPFK